LTEFHRTNALHVAFKILQANKNEVDHLIAQLKYITSEPTIAVFRKIRALNQFIEANKDIDPRKPQFLLLVYAEGMLEGLTILLKPITKQAPQEEINVCPECGSQVDYDQLRMGYFCPCGWSHYKVSDGEWVGTKPPKRL